VLFTVMPLAWEMTSHFVCAKGDALDIYTKPFAGHWFPGNGGGARALKTAIILRNIWNSRRLRPVVCKWRAEWTFSPEPEDWVFRPNLWTVRVTAMCRMPRHWRSFSMRCRCGPLTGFSETRW